MFETNRPTLSLAHVALDLTSATLGSARPLITRDWEAATRSECQAVAFVAKESCTWYKTIYSNPIPNKNCALLLILQDIHCLMPVR